MNAPSGLGVDATGNIWVASYYSAASQFSPTGSPIFPTGSPPAACTTPMGSPSTLKTAHGSPTKTAPYRCQQQAGQRDCPQLIRPADLRHRPATSPEASTTQSPSPSTRTPPLGDQLRQLQPHAALQHRSAAVRCKGIHLARTPFPVAVAIDANHNALAGEPARRYRNQGLPRRQPVHQLRLLQRASRHRHRSARLRLGRQLLWRQHQPTRQRRHSRFQRLQRQQGQHLASAGHCHRWIRPRLGGKYPRVVDYGAWPVRPRAHPGQILSPTAGWARDAGIVEGYAIAIDASGNLWITNFYTNTLTEIVGLATPVKTPQLGPVQTP